MHNFVLFLQQLLMLYVFHFERIAYGNWHCCSFLWYDAIFEHEHNCQLSYPDDQDIIMSTCVLIDKSLQQL